MFLLVEFVNVPFYRKMTHLYIFALHSKGLLSAKHQETLFEAKANPDGSIQVLP